MKGTLHTIAPTGAITTQRIETNAGASLEVLQGAVGGYIERVRVRFEGRVRDGFVNEDGLSQGLSVNRHAMALLAPPFNPVLNVIVGNLAVFVPDGKSSKAEVQT